MCRSPVRVGCDRVSWHGDPWAECLGRRGRPSNGRSLPHAADSMPAARRRVRPGCGRRPGPARSPANASGSGRRCRRPAPRSSKAVERRQDVRGGRLAVGETMDGRPADGSRRSGRAVRSRPGRRPCRGRAGRRARRRSGSPSIRSSSTNPSIGLGLPTVRTEPRSQQRERVPGREDRARSPSRPGPRHTVHRPCSRPRWRSRRLRTCRASPTSPVASHDRRQRVAGECRQRGRLGALADDVADHRDPAAIGEDDVVEVATDVVGPSRGPIGAAELPTLDPWQRPRDQAGLEGPGDVELLGVQLGAVDDDADLTAQVAGQLQIPLVKPARGR